MDEIRDVCLIQTEMDCGDPRALTSGIMQQNVKLHRGQVTSLLEVN